MSEKKPLNLVGVVILIIGIFWLGSKLFKQESWDLMICDTLMDNGIECYTNAEVLQDYKSQRECMETGIRLASKKGYECGKNCKPSKEYGGTVCETICNKAGCN